MGQRRSLAAKDENRTSTSLLRAAVAGQEESWRQLVSTYSRSVYKWCCRAGLQRADAADVAQEVFAAVARKLGDFRRDRDEHSFRKWIRAITTNKLNDFFRQRQGHTEAKGGTSWQQRIAVLAAELSRRSNSTSVRQALDDSLRCAIEQVRGEICARDWLIFERLVMDDESPSDVANELQLSPNVVYLVKSRTLKRLRDVVNASLLQDRK